MVKDLVREISNWELQLMDDSIARVTVKDINYPATYEVTDQVDEEEAPGIRLKVSYVDPSFSFGNNDSLPVTYTYLVKGINEGEILMELPRELNRRKLVALMEIK
jgi:hypothetical protein